MSAPMVQRVALIRTSDRSTFRRCRRKWNWSFSHRENRTAREQKNPLWLGTGFHFALENFHGSQPFGPNARDGLMAFAHAWQGTKNLKPPADWKELTELGIGMLDYYQLWIRNGRDPGRTFMWNGRPQCEVRFRIEIPMEQFYPGFLEVAGYDKAVYSGTLDRVIVDDYGRLWIVEYKTAKAFQTGHFDTDGQVSAYCWAASCLYNKPVAGVVYQQHKKNIPEPPKFLTSTKMFSVAKTQTTTRALYRQALLDLYGDIKKAPEANRAFLDYLAAGETENRDDLVVRHFINRNENQIEAEGRKILLETRDMLDPNIPLYPNPTRDCGWDCDFRTACVSMDDGSDWQYEIDTNTVDRTEESDEWRTYLTNQPTAPTGQISSLEAELLGMGVQTESSLWPQVLEGMGKLMLTLP